MKHFLSTGMCLEVIDADLIEYSRCIQLQREARKAVRYGYVESCLIVCRHLPVITMGRRACHANIIADEMLLRERGIRIYAVERGGDVTYHGPGQLILYPVVDLHSFGKDLGVYLRSLEAVAIGVLASYGIASVRRAGLSGVWVREKKIASVGIAVKQWITMHGLSLNVMREDLDGFRHIRPCGLDVEMTSIESEAGGRVEMREVQTRLIAAWQEMIPMPQPIGSLAGVQ